MNKQMIDRYAAALAQAEETRVPIDPLSRETAFDDLDAAYAVQLAQIERKVERGEKIVGKKIGLTSLAMQEMLGVDSPDYGHLMDSMLITGGKIGPNRLIQPKIEAEIAFVLKEDLIGPDVTPERVLEATEYVAAAFEVVDSRVKDWKIGLLDTVSDNASSGMFLLGERRLKPSEVDLKEVKMTLEKNGALVNEGVGSAALGDPAYCVAWLANKMNSYGVTLKKGEVILSGALSAAVDAKPGDVFRASFSSLGVVEVIFE